MEKHICLARDDALKDSNSVLRIQEVVDELVAPGKRHLLSKDALERTAVAQDSVA